MTRLIGTLRSTLDNDNLTLSSLHSKKGFQIWASVIF